MVQTWLFLAFGAVILYGLAQVAQKISLNSIPASGIVFLSLAVGMPVSVACLAPYIYSGAILDYGVVPLALCIVAGTFGQMGYYLYVEAAQRGPISVVGSITAAYPIMVVFVAVLFLSESPGVVQLSGALIVTCSIIALSYVHGGRTVVSSYSARCLSLCVLSLLLYGLWAIFTKLALGGIPALLFLGMYTFVIPPTVLVYNRYKGIRVGKSIPSWSVAFVIAIIASELGNMGFFLEIYAVDQGPASIVFPLVAASPVVVVLLAYMFLRERLSRAEIILVAAVLAGIVMVSVL